jgi:hypothetical protein
MDLNQGTIFLRFRVARGAVAAGTAARIGQIAQDTLVSVEVDAHENGDTAIVRGQFVRHLTDARQVVQKDGPILFWQPVHDAAQRDRFGCGAQEACRRRAKLGSLMLEIVDQGGQFCVPTEGQRDAIAVRKPKVRLQGVQELQR